MTKRKKEKQESMFHQLKVYLDQGTQFEDTNFTHSVAIQIVLSMFNVTNEIKACMSHDLVDKNSDYRVGSG